MFLVIILFVLVMFILKQNKSEDKNPLLIKPFGIKNEIVELSKEDRVKFEEWIIKYKRMIKDFKPWTWEKEIDMWNWIKATTLTEEYPDVNRFLQEAMYLQYLWKYKEAIGVYNKLWKIYPNNLVALNNIWSLYQNLWKYKLAIKLFQKIVDQYNENDYREKIVELYIKLKDPDLAMQYYLEYIKNGWTLTMSTMNAIRQLNWLE